MKYTLWFRNFDIADATEFLDYLRLKAAMKDWCIENLKGEWEPISFGFRFADKYDATQFRLRFATDLRDD